MKRHLWIENFPGAITVCDKEGVIIEMNSVAIDSFFKEGGKQLIGKSVFGCHPDKAKIKLKKLLKSEKTNIYTIEKRGKKKLIYQSPWYDERKKYSGFVEISLLIPKRMPHFIRKP